MRDLLIITRNSFHEFLDNSDIYKTQLELEGFSITSLVIGLPDVGYIFGGSYTNCFIRSFDELCITETANGSALWDLRILRKSFRKIAYIDFGRLQIAETDVQSVEQFRLQEAGSLISNLLPLVYKEANSIDKLIVNSNFLDNLNPDFINVDNAWAVLCLMSTLYNIKGENNSYIYKCDVMSIHPVEYSGEEVINELKKLLVTRVQFAG